MNETIVDEANTLREVYLALVGKEARLIRQKTQMSLKDVAKLTGASWSTVASWERGERFPTLKHALSYGRVLRVLKERGAPA